MSVTEKQYHQHRLLIDFPRFCRPLADMSDYRDDMDVDASPARDSVMFSSDNTNSKGKRSAANLPVEAEDSLPWWVLLDYFGSMTLIFVCRVEKFRPDTLEDVSGHQDILATINKFVDTNVCFPTAHEAHSAMLTCTIETPSPPSLWPAWYRQNFHYSCLSPSNLWSEEYATNGSGAQCFRRPWH